MNTRALPLLSAAVLAMASPVAVHAQESGKAQAAPDTAKPRPVVTSKTISDMKRKVHNINKQLKRRLPDNFGLQTMEDVRKNPQSLRGPGGIRPGEKDLKRQNIRGSFTVRERERIARGRPITDNGRIPSEEVNRETINADYLRNLVGLGSQPSPLPGTVYRTTKGMAWTVASWSRTWSSAPAGVLRREERLRREAERPWKAMDWWSPGSLYRGTLEAYQSFAQTGYITDVDQPTGSMTGPVDMQLIMDEASLAGAEAKTPTPDTAASQIMRAPLELGQEALTRGDAEAAVAHFSEALGSDASAEIQRWLGMSQLAAGQVDEALASIIDAYASDPSLATKPLPEGLFGNRDAFRAARNRVSIEANRRNTASAWLTLAVLMQAEDRDDRARDALKKAEHAGLSKPIGQALRSALQPVDRGR